MFDPADLASTPARADLKVGDIVAGRYELRRDLGRGGAGRVFEAVHGFTGRSVALKFIAPDVPASMRRARHPARAGGRALASVRHPGVVDVLDAGFMPDGTPFLVMDMLDGRTLEGLIAARGRLSVEDTVALAFQLTRALGAAHAAGIVHRDVKPSNVLIVPTTRGQEVIKVVDFGIARIVGAGEEKLTGIGALIGTPAYMAPEQLLALADVDARCDVYALGVAMFECLTGRMPYEGSYQQVLLQACSTDPVPPVEVEGVEVPGAVVDLVRRAMAKDRAQRFATMADSGARSSGACPKRGCVGRRTSSGRRLLPDSNPASRPRPAPEARPCPVRDAGAARDGRRDHRRADGGHLDGGAPGRLPQICPTDKRGSIRFALPIEGKVASIDVHVRWVRAARANDPEGPRALGVEFIDPPAEMTASIARYVGFMTVPE